jgi:hypothetical protein
MARGSYFSLIHWRENEVTFEALGSAPLGHAVDFERGLTLTPGRSLEGSTGRIEMLSPPSVSVSPRWVSELRGRDQSSVDGGPG